MLEGCALSDVSRILPELVRVVAHASHTTASLARAWNELSGAVQDAHALNEGTRRWPDLFDRADLGSCPDAEALEIKLGQAERAWRLITNGVG